jgi:hypothetical protein
MAGIEHPYGQALMEFAQGKTIVMPKGTAKSANQRAQKAALALAIAVQTQNGLPAAITQAREIFQLQLDNGHMALALQDGLNEFMVPANHAFIWYAAIGTLHELAWQRLEAAMDGVKALKQLTLQWWQHHLSLCSVTSVSPEGGHAGGESVLNAGSIVCPGARAAGGTMSFHRDAIYRKRFGIPQVGNAKRASWWLPNTPDLVGPFWVAKNLDTLPPTAKIGPQFLPMLSNPMTVQRYTLGFRAFFQDGITPAATFDPTVRAWMDYANWQAGFTLLPSGPSQPEPGPPWPGELVAEVHVKGKTPNPAG